MCDEATSVPILVFLSLSVLDLDPMYATDRQTDVRQKQRLMSPPIRGVGIIILTLLVGPYKISHQQSLKVLFGRPGPCLSRSGR